MKNNKSRKVAEENAGRVLRANFKAGKRLKGVEEMPLNQFSQMGKNQASTRRKLLYRSPSPARRNKFGRSARIRWSRILLVSGVVLTAFCWLCLSALCTFYQPPKYYDWQTRYTFGPWQDMSDGEECRMNAVEMIKRWEWHRLSSR